MAAPMVSNNSISKKTLRNIILGNIVGAITLIFLLYAPLHGNSQLDIVSNPFFVSKILSASVLFLHGILRFFTLPQINRGQKLRIGLFIKVSFV